MTPQDMSLTIADAQRANLIALMVGALVFFLGSLLILYLRGRARASTQYHLLTETIVVVSFLLLYVLYSHVTTATEEALLNQFIESGFICLVPGLMGKLIIPAASIGLAVITSSVWTRHHARAAA
jgi:presenilin-like A22 family membrane protease